MRLDRVHEFYLAPIPVSFTLQQVKTRKAAPSPPKPSPATCKPSPSARVATSPSLSAAPSALSGAVLQRADLQLSFGPMTFPIQLKRMILVEQIYRGFTILRGEPCHK